jgi:hypothetical protein
MLFYPHCLRRKFPVALSCQKSELRGINFFVCQYFKYPRCVEFTVAAHILSDVNSCKVPAGDNDSAFQANSCCNASRSAVTVVPSRQCSRGKH